jgi:hypothetical protein
MENTIFIGVNLSDVRGIMMIMCVLVKEFVISGDDMTDSST